MVFKIFNVSHGFCGYLIADTNNVMLFDCGYNSITGFKPSQYLRQTRCTGIEYLVISNFDQDHVSDLPNIVKSLPINLFYRNQSIPVEDLRKIKKENGPITPEMQVALDLHKTYIHDVTDYPTLGVIEFNLFNNKYPAFKDTNNLSLVSFIHYDNMSIIYPGDLEKEGWKELLKDSAFISNLRRVTIFIASHHGRENGYCEEVFNYCQPKIIIISDMGLHRM